MNPLFDLAGHTAVVTGGSRGIGLMIARGLLDAGARVVISSRDAAACDAARTELAPHGDALAVPADVSTETGCVALAERVVAAAGPVHVLVNNAGATWGAPFDSFPASAWDKVLDLNLKSPFFLTRALLPSLRATATADDPSRVINVGSIDGLRVTDMPTYSYSASKAALHQMTRVLAHEFGPQHITVNAIAPGPFESKMMARTLQTRLDDFIEASPLGRIGRADDMAGVAVFLAARAGSYVTGTILPVDGGIYTTR